MKKNRRKYDKEYKKMAVELCIARNDVSSVALELGIEANLLSRWRREYINFSSSSFPGNGNALATEDQKVISNLRKELREISIERDILKKAVGIFSKSDGKNFSS